MKTVHSFLSNTGSVSLLFLLFLTITFSIGCRQAEEQPEETTTDAATEEVTSQDQEETSEEPSEKTDSEIESAEEPTGTEETATKSEKTAKKSDDDKVVATVNGNPIYENELKGNRTLDDNIMNEIFYIEGLNKGYDERFAKQLEDYKKRIISSAVKKEVFNQIPKQQASEEEMKEYYKKNEFKYTHLTVKQLTLKDRKTAEEVREKAVEGTPFEDIVSEYKDKDVSILIKEYRLPTNLNDFFDKMQVGNVSEVQKNDKGYQVLKITQVQKIPFEKAKPAIRHNVIGTKRGEAMQREADKIKEKLGIEVEIKE